MSKHMTTDQITRLVSRRRRVCTAWAHHEADDDAVIIEQRGDLSDATQDELRTCFMKCIDMMTGTTKAA